MPTTHAYGQTSVKCPECGKSQGWNGHAYGPCTVSTFYPEPCTVTDAHGNSCGATAPCDHAPKVTPTWADSWLSPTERKAVS